MQASASQPLIVGAGPTGLAAALFLAEHGVAARLIDRAEEASRTSRALAVNPRSLELLRSSGVAAAIQAEGRAIEGVCFYEDWKPLATLQFDNLPSRYAMTVLPQARIEALLAEALAWRGVKVERGVAFEAMEQDATGVRARLRAANGEARTVAASLLLGADGAHSQVREALGIPFKGHAFPEAWPLFDLELDDPLDLDHAHVDFLARGLVFLLGLRPGLWRVFGDVPDLLSRLPRGARPGRILWESSFHIADKCADRVEQGRAALAGDAAHIHSPVGARGMNLGIEDAYVFAACAANALGGAPGWLADYGRLRHPVHAKVVARMDRLTALARGQPAWVRLARHYLFPALAGFGPFAHKMQNFVAGLDEPTKVR